MSPHRSIRLALALSCVFALSCGPGGSSNAPPPMPTPPAPPSYYSVPEGPAKSALDVRLTWIVSDGGARVIEGIPVFAQMLSGHYGQRIDCTFGPYSQPFDTRLPCVPQYPSAIVDQIGNLYADAACQERLTAEDKSLRMCQPPLKLVVVVNASASNQCLKSINVREVEIVPTPAAPYVMAGGRCQPGPAGKDTLQYYKLGRQLDDGEIPQGSRAVEGVSPTQP